MNKQRNAKLKPYHRKILQRLKRIKGCNSCGYRRHHAALHFHHVVPKETGGKAIQYGWSPTKIRAELKKCVILCANCHAETHNEDNIYGK